MTNTAKILQLGIQKTGERWKSGLCFSCFFYFSVCFSRFSFVFYRLFRHPFFLLFFFFFFSVTPLLPNRSVMVADLDDGYARS